MSEPQRPPVDPDYLANLAIAHDPEVAQESPFSREAAGRVADAYTELAELTKKAAEKLTYTTRRR